MKIIDKNSVLDSMGESEGIALELGCGHHKRHPEAIGIDQQDYPGVDIVGEAYGVLQRMPAASVSCVYAYHFFEHQLNIESYMTELNRIMIPDALLLVVTPHFSNPYYYSDPTHRTPFGLYSFSYFCKNNYFSREVPLYFPEIDFELMAVNLIFKSSLPFYLRWGFKKMFQPFFNLNRYMMELYEENFCYFIPCYEIRYKLAKRAES